MVDKESLLKKYVEYKNEQNMKSNKLIIYGNIYVYTVMYYSEVISKNEYNSDIEPVYLRILWKRVITGTRSAQQMIRGIDLWEQRMNE